MRAFTFFFLYSCIFYGQDMDSISRLKKNTLDRGLSAYFNKNDEIVKESINQLYKFYTEDNDSAILAKIYQYKAMYHDLKYQIDSSFYFYNQSMNISKLTNDSLEVGRRLLSITILQREAKDFLGSEISSIEALQYLEPIKSYRYLQNVYSNLGLVSGEIKQKEDALKYFDLSLKANRLNKNSKRKERGYLHTINNIGLIHQQGSEHEKAIEYFNKGLKYDSIKQKYPDLYALLLENLTYSGIALGRKNFAEDHYNEVIQIREKEKEFSDLSITHVLLSEFYIEEKSPSKARFHANEALKYAKQTHNNKRWLEALKLLSDLSTGNQSKAYLNEYITLNDSLLQQERQLKNQFAKIRYETDKKEKENEALKIENEKTLAEAEAQKQRATIGLLLSGISIMFLLSSISFFRFRRKKLLFLTQLQKIEAREEERRQIAKSLHDEVAGDLRLLHRKLEKSLLLEEAQKLEMVKDNVRNLSHQLSSVSFEEVPFRDQVINLVSDYFSPEFIIKVNGLKEIDWSQANNSIKRMLYLSLRECIQNCQKYAEASKMTISFSIHKKSVLLDVVDNGKGFDTATQKKGIGLLNLQERVQELNGTLTIESEVGKGTHIIIQTPLNA
ncbi:signal transduction histidine kinase [Tenacibaculum skagerrakense]|uniref:histidine kinase n=2 Tax=Tenacibaculum skagerrakense TaxID=186571 RepID=A0A4R2P2L0_9FLAO|nr:signal transduction histidine kinase [Tenacibaculum skagerrakense]